MNDREMIARTGRHGLTRAARYTGSPIRRHRDADRDQAMTPVRSGGATARRRLDRRQARLAIGVLSIAGVATGASLFSPVVPAQAATTYEGCTVTPTLPTADTAITLTGTKLVNYRGSVFCPAGKIAEVYRERWEQDLGAPDNYLGFTTTIVSVTGLWWDQHPLPDTDGPGDDREEVYQRVKIRVINTATGLTTHWSGWELTSAAAILQ
jgi:hypothetical protein